MTLTNDELRSLLETVPLIKKVETLQKSSEGGEHDVWALDDEYILRMPASSEMNSSFTREKDLHQLLSQRIKLVPKIIHSGKHKSKRYAIYEKAKGNSIEASANGTNEATERDLAELLRRMNAIPIDEVRKLGYSEEEKVDMAELQKQAAAALARLDSHHQVHDAMDIETTLALPPDVSHPVIVTHADLKGEHIFIDRQGHVTGVIDWSDTQIGHPSTDVGGLAISIGAAAARRAARLAGYAEDIIDRGIFQARCSTIILLDELLNEDDDSPEWLVRLQLQRALETE